MSGVNPHRTLLVLASGALAYALAQTMIVPALPAADPEPRRDRPDPRGVFGIGSVVSALAGSLEGARAWRGSSG